MESRDWGDVDIMHSVSYVKGQISKRIDIGERKRQRVPRKGTINNSSLYDYDYRVVKPRGGAVNFGVVRGRAQKSKTEQSYSYQHY